MSSYVTARFEFEGVDWNLDRDVETFADFLFLMREVRAIAGWVSDAKWDDARTVTAYVTSEIGTRQVIIIPRFHRRAEFLVAR